MNYCLNQKEFIYELNNLSKLHELNIETNKIKKLFLALPQIEKGVPIFQRKKEIMDYATENKISLYTSSGEDKYHQSIIKSLSKIHKLWKTFQQNITFNNFVIEFLVDYFLIVEKNLKQQRTSFIIKSLEHNFNRMIRDLNDEYEKLKQNQYIKYIVSRQKTGKDNINLKKNQIQNEIEEVSNGLNLVFEQVENIQKKIK